MTGVAAKAPETTFRHPASFSGLELERVRGAAQPLAPQLLGDYCLLLCLQGPAISRYRGKAHALKDATFQSYGAGETLAAAPRKGGHWSYQTVRLSPELMHSLASATGQKLPPFTVPVSPKGAVNQQLGTLFTDAFSSLEEDAPDQEEKLVALTRTLLAHQAEQPRAVTVTPRAEHAVETTKVYLKETIHSPASLEQMAEHAVMSKFHLSRLFKQVVGISPSVFQMSLRVREAKRLLRRNEPLAHVAFDLGFSDQAHFTRTFKRFVGVTPGQYQVGGVAR